MTTPKVSIITPSYNQAEFISDTLDSVKNQSYNNTEHIVIDGNSTDGTKEILEKYEKEYSLTYISEEDKGQTDAINKGFNLASGNIVAWLNSDDVYFDTGVISRVASYFDEYDSEIIYGDICQIGKNSEVIRVKPSREFSSKELKAECYIPQPATFFSKSVIENEKLDDSLVYTMDYEYWLRLSETFSFKYVSDVLAGFRRYEEQKSQTEELVEERLKMFEKRGLDRHSNKLRLILNGLNWRLRSAYCTLDLYHTPPELAYNGTFPPLHKALTNLRVID